MPDVCTCGAQLPPDARFCHKCGKPQREEPLIPPDELEEFEIVAEPPPLPGPPPTPEPAPRISLFNAQAVSIALIAWVMTFAASVIGNMIRLPQALSLLWLPAGGFLTVFLYRRRTGFSLTPRNGAQLGWLCGVFGFLMATVILTLLVTVISDPQVATQIGDQLRANGVPEDNVTQFFEVFRSPGGVFEALMVAFVMFSLLPAFGGILGAKLLGRAHGPNGS